MLVERPDLLRAWLTTTLKKMCDADPEPLGKYILALVKKDRKELKTFLLEQLEVFLIEETSKFVELLFDTLQTKSYMKSTVPDDVADQSSPADISSSQPSKNLKSPLDSPKTDILKDKKEVKTKPTNDLTAKSHSRSSDITGLPFKRKSDYKHSSTQKEPYKPSYNSEDSSRRNNSTDGYQDKSRLSSKSSPKEEAKYTPTGVSQKNKPDFLSKNEPSPKKMKHCDLAPHGDTDYRKTGDLQLAENIPEQRRRCPSYSATRCKDYDEKGYCLRGNLCGFDHGSDPILVEHTPDQFLTSLKAVNFGVNLAPDKFEGSKPSPYFVPPLPTSPPRIPPPPPLPPPTGFVAEPYNPEAPGMNMVTHLNFYNPSEPPPELPPSLMPKSSIQMQSQYFGETDPYNKPKQGRIRELINVTKTVDSRDNDESQNKDGRTCLKPLNNSYSSSAPREAANSGDFRIKRFDYSRLGPCPRTSLEVRKIPRKLNTIKNLHQHFSKFGNIVNIEIGLDNDPGAAKVQFSSNSEAAAAYRSPDAILQNRFIKVFYSNDAQSRRTDTNFLKEMNTRDSFQPSENLKGAQSDSISESNDDKVLEDKVLDKVIGNPLASKGSVPLRSVYISNPPSQGVKKVFPKLSLNNKGAQEGGIATHHKMKLLQKKTDLVNNAIQHQKLILEQLIKTTKKKEKVFLKKTLDTISKKVEELTKDLKKDNEELKSLLKCPPQMDVSKIAAKELLDAELDLYKKQHTHSDEDTTELLLKKVNLMKTKAKALGLIESSPAFRRNVIPRYNTASLRIDHRPRKALAVAKKSTDSEELKVEMQSVEVEEEEDEEEEDSEARSWRR